MSSFNDVVLKPVKRRLGFTVVIGAAALIAVLLTGSSIVAAIAVLVAVIALGAILDRRQATSATTGFPGRSLGGPFTASYRWRTNQKPNLDDLYQALSQRGLVRNVQMKSPSKVVLQGGSQLWMRVLGGYFIDPKRLPLKVTLGTPDLGANDEFVVELDVRDSMGIGIRDEALGERYARAAVSIQKVVSGELDVLGGHEVDVEK